MALHGLVWEDQILKMLGKAFTAKYTAKQMNSDMVAFAISSPGGSKNGILWFPSEVVSKSGIAIFQLSFVYALYYH